MEPIAKSTSFTDDPITCPSGASYATRANTSPRLDVVSDAPMPRSLKHELGLQPRLWLNLLILRPLRREVGDDLPSEEAEGSGSSKNKRMTMKTDL
jgi:hypothetical protein